MNKLEKINPINIKLMDKKWTENRRNLNYIEINENMNNLYEYECSIAKA